MSEEKKKNDFWLEKISPVVRFCSRHLTLPHWVEPWRVIADHELILHEGTRHEVVLNQEVLILEDGDFLLVAPGNTQETKELDGKRGTRYCIHFDWEFSEQACNGRMSGFRHNTVSRENYRLAPGYIPVSAGKGRLTNRKWAFELATRMGELWAGGRRIDRLRVRALMLELLIGIFGVQEEQVSGEGGKLLANRARMYLDELTFRPMGKMPMVQTVLERLGFSYAHVEREFKKEFGLSPLSYVNASRVARAKQLLRDTDLTVLEVGYRTGFDSPAYFSRCFKRNVGVSPREYRKGERLKKR